MILVTDDLKLFFRTVLSISFLLFGHWGAERANAQSIDSNWPHRVLITNDNGIEDAKIIALARAFSKVADTYVVTSMSDRSGSSNQTPALKTGKIEADRRNLGKGIHAYAIKGAPADAVVFALAGLMKGSPPDVVISGINGGPNLGTAWLGSGTIGAARTAAFAGIPALAVSGVKDDSPGSKELQADIQWIVVLAQSQFVRQMKRKEYLTIGFPELPPAKVKGIRVAPRAGLLINFQFQKTAEAGNEQTWKLQVKPKAEKAPENSDVGLHKAGYIVVTPMHVDEQNYEMIDRLKEDPDLLPEFNR